MDMAKTMNSKEFFSRQWQVYEKILEHDYMGHREIYQVLQETFLVFFKSVPINILDLGCGDARFISKALLKSNINSYYGIDLSPVALEIAKTNMQLVGCQNTFRQGNFYPLERLLSQKNSFNCILSSFAIHHLSSLQKELHIGEIYRILQPGGIFFLIDIVLREKEDRNAYMLRYLQEIKENWSLLSTDDYEMLENHITSSDYPESLEVFREMGLNNHFDQVDCLYRDPLKTMRLLAFQKK